MFSLTFGIMVGSGIYLKNSDQPGSALGTSHSAIVGILMWVIVGSICTMIILVFMEAVSSFKKGENTSLPNITVKFWNKKVGSWISFYIMFVFIPIVVAIDCLYTIKLLFQAINDAMNLAQGKANEDLLAQKLGGAGARSAIEISCAVFLFILFTAANYKSKNLGKGISTVTTILKFIPLLGLIFAGFIMSTTINAFNPAYKPGANNVLDPSKVTIMGVLQLLFQLCIVTSDL